MKESIISEIRRLGTGFGPETLLSTRALFRPEVEAAPFANRKRIVDVPYGAHERHLLDIYPSDQPGSPVVLFVHGGGFVGGDKGGDGVFYCNVGRYFAHHGYTGVTMNYRLAPAHSWPAGSEDVAAALHWIAQNIGEYGGDGSRIVLLGQSAGAGHSAGVLFDKRFAPPPGLKGVALMAGYYSANPPMAGGPDLYFGADPEYWEDRSPITHVQAGHLPVALSIGEYDPAAIADQTLLLAQALNRADGHPPRLTWFEGDNHFSSVHSLGVDDDPVGKNLRAFFASVLV